MRRDHSYEDIIANLEKLKKQRASSGDRKKGSELKRLTEEVVDQVKTKIVEEIQRS